jgi:hypothetical protein
MPLNQYPHNWLPDEMGELAITCWCDTTVVHVPARWVTEGRTRSCGRKDCHAPT